MIEFCTGDLFDADVEALVNPVNCVGAMGRGLALEFRRMWPEVYEEYRAACDGGRVKVGSILTVRVADDPYILNFPTKRHYRDPSSLDDIESGMQALVEEVRKLGLTSIAIPALGCGLGGLAWDDVRPVIVGALEALPDVHVQLFPPQGAPSEDGTVKPGETQ